VNDIQIKKAYNKMSIKWHPDKHVNSTEEQKATATTKFQEISQAKEILSDTEKRRIYDQIGMDIFKNGMDNQHNFHHGGNPFGDIFGSNFPFGMGGFSSGMRGHNMGAAQQAPENITEEINITLEQIYNEDTIQHTYKQKINCSKCDGEGTKDGKKIVCTSCNGRGVKVNIIQVGPMIQQSIGNCNTCNGKGKIINPENNCEICNGKCYVIKDKTIQIPLKSGLTHGNKIELTGKGNQLKTGKSNLVLVINEQPHNKFKRINADLFIDVNIKLYQSLFGFDKLITHLDGRKIHISSTGKTEFNTIRKIHNEGMRSLQTGFRGDLYIKFNIDLPNLSNIPLETRSQLKIALQTFDKQEVQNESQVLTTSNLIKTMLIDLSPDQKDAILEMLANKKTNNKKQSSNRFNNNSDDEGVQHECTTQ
jgi:DnaJ-class molecular chaperone